MKTIIYHIRRSELAYPLAWGIIAGLLTGVAILLAFSVGRAI